MSETGATGQRPIERVVLIGFRGQLGRALLESLATQRAVLALDYPEIDMTRPAIIEQVCDWKPQVVINAAAWTDVDGAEEKQDACYAVNVLGVKHLATACQRSGAALLHVSTNEVFPGDSRAASTESGTRPARAAASMPAARRPPRSW